MDPELQAVAIRFGTNPKLLRAVELAEGNLLKAVQCSVPSCATHAQALEITCRSANHALWDFVNTHAELRQQYVAYFAQRWAPVGAANDPTKLNQNWPGNVLRLWEKL